MAFELTALPYALDALEPLFPRKQLNFTMANIMLPT